MDITIDKLPGGHGFGAVIEGLEPWMLDNSRLQGRLQDLWRRKSLLVFRGSDGADVHARLAATFGVVGEHPMQRTPGSMAPPRPVDIFFDDGKGCDLYQVEGVLVGGYQPWHIDWIYLDEIARGGVMRAVTLPDTGGATGFIDRANAYDALPQALQAEIQDLHVLYRYDADASHVKFGAHPERCIQISDRLTAGSKNPRVSRRSVHPLVFHHPLANRPVLNLSQWFADEIEGMHAERGDRLLRELIDRLTDRDRAYFHDWQPRDIVLWDNWQALHCATGVPVGNVRHMVRIDLTDDYSCGRYEAPSSYR